MVVGYKPYLDQIRDLTSGKLLVATGMTHEKERCEAALEHVLEGRQVALVSSGDAGIYGMAGLALEMLAARELTIPLEIIPGVTAASAAAARLGAPLMLDFACISLSDLLVPWAVIEQRLEALAAADLVTALYNPRSRRRVTHLDEAARIFRQHRPSTTPVGIATALGTSDETWRLSDLESFTALEITMKSIVIIGNRASRNLQGYFVTPRGYRL